MTVFATVTPVAYRGTTTGTANATAADLEIPIAPTAIYLPYRADYTDHLGGKMSIVYGQGHTSVVKPFIVVEGYNTARIAPHLVGENNKNNDIESFLISIDIRFSSGISYKDALYQAGYDIVYIDFTEGTDDIRRNAALFEEVVRRVNTMKAQAGSTEPNVVMGESMGGLVARYGLARLVRGGYNPQTRLLMLHDSPQRGANNPMGLQALTRQADFPLAILFGNTNAMLRTSDVSDQLKEALAILDAPATKQLSLKSVTGINYEYEDNSFIDGPYRTMVDFGPSGGAPAAFPVIVATSDGSQCGRSQNTPAYQELTRNTRDYIIGLSYLVRLGVQSEAIANALPAYGTQNTIAHLRLWFTLRVLWLKSNITLLERNYTSPPNTLPYETLPGGTTNLSEQSDLVSNYSRNFIGFWRFANNTSIYNGDVCFVPTYSALDVVSVSPATAYAKYINNITDNVNPPRVARYIAQESVNSAGTQFNQAHIRFTARNSEWIFSQMQSIVPVCTPADQECSPLQLAISGGPLVCAGTGTSFTLSGQPAGASVSWSVSPAGSTVPATGTGATFTTTASTTTGVSGTVTATVTVGCGTYTPSKAIAIGKPRPVAVKTSATGEPTTYLFTAPSLPGVTYQWYRGTTLIDGETTSELSYYFPCNTSVTISYGFANDCAPGSRSAGLTKTGECIRTGTALTATLAPNPAREGVDVHIEHADPAQPLTVRLFDSYGQLRAEQTATNQKLLHLRTDKLPAGLYFVQLLQGQQVLQRLPLQVDK